MHETPRTTLRDAVLAQVSPELDADAVCAVEWAALDDTRAAVLNHHELLDFDEYQAAAAAL